MSAETFNTSIAYLAQGRIRVKTGSDAPRTLESAYGNSIREKAVRAQQKHSWKTAGHDSAMLSGAMLWGKQAAPDNIPLAITSICGGTGPGELFYSLQSGSLCALLEVGGLGAEEKRIWNDNRTQIRHVSVSHDSGDMVFSVLHQNGTANIGVRLAGESGIKELTEGDSFDTAPRWLPGPGRRILYQSAGIGRNREGHFLALGPFGIQQLDAEAGDLDTLLEDKRYDYLAPQGLPDGTLLYIRRPYSLNEPVHPLRALKDVVLFPFRLAYAGLQFLNFFSAAFTGKKLTSASGPKNQDMNLRQMMIWGNLVHAQQKGRQVEDEAADLVPKSWQLYRQAPNSDTTVLASAVLAYDVAPDGRIVFTNGNAVFILHPDGRKEKLLTESMIEQVFFVPA
jgi:hypothetical protein